MANEAGMSVDRFRDMLAELLSVAIDIASPYGARVLCKDERVPVLLKFFDWRSAGPIDAFEYRVIKRGPLRVRDSGFNQSVAQVGEEENGCTRCVRFFAFELSARAKRGRKSNQRPKSGRTRPRRAAAA